MKNNLFNSDTTHTQHALTKTYGLSFGRIIRTLIGKDEEYAKELGERGKQGRFVKAVEPTLRKDLIDAIEGNDLQNKLISDVMSKTVAGTKTSETQVAKAQLEEQKLINFRLEKAYDYVESTQFESKRHSNEMRQLQAKWSIDNNIADENNRVKMQATLARPELLQLAEDERARQARVKHYLEHGEASRVDLLPHAHYETTSIGGVFRRFISFFFT